MVKLKDVAEYVGVSISTVSRVISNDTSRSVNAETRKKIWDAVTKLGYQPNRIAKQLVKGSGQKNQPSFKIGCIVAVPQNKYNHPYFSVILEGIEKGLSEQGYMLGYIHSADEMNNSAFLHKVIQEQDVDGIILVEGTGNETYEYIKKHVPIIVGIDTSDTMIPRITYDRMAASKFAVKHLIDQGHTKIGYIGGPGLSGQIEKEKRYRGYKDAMEDAGLSINRSWVLNSNWNVDLSYELMRDIVESGKAERPTAIFAASDMMAISAMRAVNEKGLKIPDDIAFIGIDDIEFSQYSSPPLSTIHIPKFEIGYIAAKTLIDYINKQYPIPVKIQVPFELKVRHSSDPSLFL